MLKRSVWKIYLKCILMFVFCGQSLSHAHAHHHQQQHHIHAHCITEAHFGSRRFSAQFSLVMATKNAVANWLIFSIHPPPFPSASFAPLRTAVSLFGFWFSTFFLFCFFWASHKSICCACFLVWFECCCLCLAYPLLLCAHRSSCSAAVGATHTYTHAQRVYRVGF